MKTNPNEVTVRIHYFTRDTEFHGDYTGIEILFDGQVVKEFGDAYHDGGEHESWIEGVEFVLGPLHAKVERVADYEP